MKPLSEFSRRLEIVRRIAQLNSGRTVFAHEENLQLVVAASLFTTAELQRMLADAEALSAARPSPLRTQSDTSAA